MNSTPLYRGTVKDAQESGALQLWKDSFQANVLCRQAIENEIRQHFDGVHLGKGCTARVVDEFGLDRVKYVLSATLQEKDYDGRFSRSNRSWGKETAIAHHPHNYEFYVQFHPTVLDGFISAFRAEYQESTMDRGSQMQMEV